MRNIKITYLKPGWYEVEEDGLIYRMDIHSLSHMQIEISRIDKSKTPVSDWYNKLDIDKREKIEKIKKDFSSN